MSIDAAFPKYFDTIHPFKAGDTKNMTPGQIAWVPTMYISQHPQVFDFERATANDHANIKFKVRNMTADDFKKQDRKLPVAALTLSKHEEYLIAKAKKRPCIYLGRNPDADTELHEATKGKHHYTNCNGLFIPIFGANNDNAGGFPKEIVQRTKYLMYPHFFYIKQETPPNSEDIVDEGVARLDYLFSCSLAVPGVTPRNYKLNDKLLTFFITYLSKYMSIPTDPNNQKSMDDVLEIISLYWKDLCK